MDEEGEILALNLIRAAYIEGYINACNLRHVIEDEQLAAEQSFDRSFATNSLIVRTNYSASKRSTN